MNVGWEAAAPSGEESLLARARSDPDTFAAFYDRYCEAVLRYFAGRLLEVEIALDLMSETFAKALRQRLQFRGATQSEERAWLFAIAGSELSNYWRRGEVERRAQGLGPDRSAWMCCRSSLAVVSPARVIA